MKKLVGICVGAALLTGTGMLVQAQDPGSASLKLTGSATVNPDVGGPTPGFAGMRLQENWVVSLLDGSSSIVCDNAQTRDLKPGDIIAVDCDGWAAIAGVTGAAGGFPGGTAGAVTAGVLGAAAIGGIIAAASDDDDGGGPPPPRPTPTPPPPISPSQAR